MKKCRQVSFTVILMTILLWVAMNCGLSNNSCAAVPHLINYQGRLTDKGGKPLEGAYDLTFRIYDGETAGNLLWEEIDKGVTIQKGVFSILLGGIKNLDIPFDKQYYLEIQIGSEVMTPRQRITSSGYAIRAEKAEDANTVNNISVSATPAPNKLLPLDSGGKLPLSVLKTYDSGWFPVSGSSTYTKAHNLGTTKLLVTVYFSTSSDGSGIVGYAPTGGLEVDQDGRASYFSNISALTTTSISINTGVGFYADVGSVPPTNYTSGYYRIIMLALE